MTALEIIEDTLKYYETNPRGVTFDNEGNTLCAYTQINSYGTKIHCAVGRCLLPKHQKPNEDWNLEAVHDLESYEAGGDINTMLQSKYKGQTSEFWNDLQSLHDYEKYWSNDGELTSEGLERAETLREKYAS